MRKILLILASVLELATASSRTARAQTNMLVADGVVQAGRIEHFAISESSGLAASRRHPGVIWTHNDGGYQFLFAITEAGNYLGAFEVTGAQLIDWEAIAADDFGNLYLADIGSNGLARTHVAVHWVPEPNPARRYGNAEVRRTWYLAFPGPRQDCESFFVFDGFGYLISKSRALDDRVTLYRYPLTSRAGSVLLEEVTRFSVTAAVTDAGISEDGRLLGVLTSQGAYVIQIDGQPASVASAPREFTPFLHDFMEGGTFTQRGFLVSAETREMWLFTNGTFQCHAAARLPSALPDRTALAGSVVTFNQTVLGCPVPEVSWRFNGQLLPGETSSTLVLSNVSAAQAGRYEIVGSNRFGTARRTVALDVRSVPELRVKLEDDKIKIEFEAIAGHRHFLEFSDDPSGGRWTPLGDSVTGTNDVTVSFEDVRNDGSRFYRLLTCDVFAGDGMCGIP